MGMGKDQVQISMDHVMTQVNIYFSNFDGAWNVYKWLL